MFNVLAVVVRDTRYNPILNVELKVSFVTIKNARQNQWVAGVSIYNND